jgi:hypothetical protein
MFQVNLCLLNIYTQHLEAIQDKKYFSWEFGVWSGKHMELRYHKQLNPENPENPENPD